LESNDDGQEKTPPEKKQAEYERDHYAFAWHSPHGFRKTWKKKKNYRNRVVRRKSKNLLHEAEGRSLRELGPNEESFTSERFRKGLSKKTVHKSGIVNLREKIQTKKERSENRGETRKAFKERLAVIYAEGIVALERHPDSTEARKLMDGLRFGDCSLRDFLSDHPDWRVRLRARINRLHKQQKQMDEKARLKQEQKRKWRSPTLRLPRPV
jgi:hypothetical protein